MNKYEVLIKKNPNGDTRTAPKDVNFGQFQVANDMHINDVASVMLALGMMLNEKGKAHDWTKKAYEEEFYHDFLDTINNGSNFIKGEWYKMHVEKERHHLLTRCPEDVNLLDIIEMIVDCICAGKARSGGVYPIDIPVDILKRAVTNTVKTVDDMVEVEDGESN